MCDRLDSHRSRALEIDERHEANRQQTAIDRTEVDDGAVVRTRDAVGEVWVSSMLVTDEVIGQERVEDELAREAETIERPWPILANERAHRAPILSDHDLLLGLGALRRVAMASPELLDERLLSRLATGQPKRLETVANARDPHTAPASPASPSRASRRRG